MEGGELTLWKDIDRKIIENLDEKSILSICSSSKKLFTQICNDDFIQSLLEKRYPESTKYKPKNQSWKNFLLTVFYWKGKLKEDFGFNYAGGDFKREYIVLKNSIGSSDILSEAAHIGDLNLAKHAMENGANVHLYNETPLRYAIINGKLEMVKFLAERGANIHYGNDILTDTAARNFHLDIYKYLVSKGLDPNLHKQVTIDKIESDIAYFKQLLNNAPQAQKAYYQDIVDKNEEVLHFLKDLWGR